MPQGNGAKSEELRNSEIETAREDYLFVQRINVGITEEIVSILATFS
jgi:hypothetical protein